VFYLGTLLSVDVPFWANRRDEIPAEVYSNFREEIIRLHPMRGKEVKLI